MASNPGFPSGPVRTIYYPGELDRLLRTPGGPVGRHLNRIAQLTAVRAEALSRTVLKVRSGRYSSGFRVEVEAAPYPQGFKFVVVNRAIGFDPKRAYSYASTIELGSVAHPIKARNPDVKLLRFYWASQGRWVTSREIAHRGTKAYSILRISLQEAVTMI